ncbi:unnamed protein product [Caenorhabditis nigoni]
MNEAVIKEEVIEEDFNFTFKNGDYIEVKQEKIEKKPEYFLEQKIKTEPIDFFETNETEQEFFDDIEQMPREYGTKIETVSTEFTKFKCEICQKAMPKNLLQLIISEDNKTVLVEMFKLEESQEKRIFYVCVSHIQKIIDENDGKLKSPDTRSEQLLRIFISKHKKLMRARKSRRRTYKCTVCHMTKECSEVYRVSSKSIRIVVMVGCILGGTHSIDQAKSFLATHNVEIACYSDCKKSIDMIFEHLGVGDVLELSKCSTKAMENLMNTVKKIDSNFTVDQFVNAFRELFLKNHFQMNESVGKEEVIEKEHDFTVKNDEFNESEGVSEDVELKPKKSDSEIENNPPKNYGMLKCEICQEAMPRNLMKKIKMKVDKDVLSEIFEIKGSMGITTPYVCLSHIRKIISDNYVKVKIPITSFEHHLRSFIRRNKYSMNDSKSQRRICDVCHTSKDCTELYTVSSKSVRIVIMIGCILRGTHSIEQAIPYITTNRGDTCHSHCKESIDMIFEHLGVRSVLELWWCSVQAKSGLMDIVKNIDPNFTLVQFTDACRGLVLKNEKFENNL